MFGDTAPPPAEVAALLDTAGDESEYDTLHSRMLECVDDFDRGRCALTLLLQSTESTTGYLFGIHGASVKLLAALPEGSNDPVIVGWIEEFVHAELRSGEIITASATADDTTESLAGPRLRFMHPDGRHFEAQPLTTEARREQRMVAVLALELGPGPLILPPKQLCNDLALSLYEHGLSGIMVG